MSKKFIYLISSVLMFVLAANASAATRAWDGEGGANKLWSLPANWLGDIVPIAGDDADIDINDANCIINSTVTAVCGSLDVGYSKKNCILNMSGGTLTVTVANIGIGGDSPADGNGIFIMSGGDVNIATGRLWIGYGRNTGGKRIYGTLFMSGGEITIPVGSNRKIELGKNKSAIGQIYMDGGTINIGDDFEIGNYGKGTLDMNDGTINVDDFIKLGANGGTGRIYLDGGTINCDDITITDTNSNTVIDITEGEMVVESDDALAKIQEYAAAGSITAYGGDGVVSAVLSGGAIHVTGVYVDPNLASTPIPADYAQIDWTLAGPTLSWTSGRNAASHDVYFGTDFDEVNDANTSSPEWQCNQPKNDTDYSYGQLSIGTTYYWRIDEVNALHPVQLWKGSVWRFTLRNYIIVDDMDEYGDSGTKPWVPGSRIYYVWRDGWFVDALMPGNKTGSQVGHWYDTDEDFSESVIVRSGLSMPLYYENDGSDYSKPVATYNQAGLKYYSEAQANTTGNNSLPDIDNDWTIDDVEALSLWFRGDPNNDPNILKMYVALGDADSNGVVYYTGDINDIKKIQWKEWNIPLSSFTGVTLTDVRRIYIGFGERGNVTTKSGKGIMYLDDIRLYPARCVPELLKPEADLDNDCDVDYDDLDVMTADWVESDYTGKGHDGVLKNFPTDNSQWVTDPNRGRCLLFDGINDWVDIDDNEFSNFQDKTISVWVNIKAFPSSYPYVFCFQNATTDPYRIYLRTRGSNIVRVHFVEDYTKDYNQVTINTWHHLAFVLRNTGVDGCTGEFYGDGALIDQLANRPRHTGYALGVNLGSFSDGGMPFINALYDDFRVYNAALSLDNIKYLANKPAGVAPTADMLLRYDFNEVSGQIAANSSTYVFNRPLLSPAELYDSEAVGLRKVNFKDYAILVANDWLKDAMLWP